MRRNGQNYTSGQIFYPKFETAMSCFLFDYELWWRLLQDLCVFWAKTAFVMQIVIWGLVRVGAKGDHFLTNPPKGTSLPDSRVLSHYACRFVHGFYRAACNADAVLRGDFCLSVCPSVRPSVRLSVTRVIPDKTEERSVQIFTPYETTFILVFWEEEWLVGGDPFYLKFWVNRPPLEKNRRFSTDNRS